MCDTLNSIEIILLIIIAIFIIMLIVLYLGIRITSNLEKLGPKLTFNLKIEILSKIKIYEYNYPQIDKKEKDKYEEQMDIKEIYTIIKPSLKILLDFFKKVLKSFEIKKLYFHLDFGLDSYVDTAKYVGYMWAALVFLNSLSENIDLSVQPIFTQPLFDFNGNLDVKFKLIDIIIPSMKLLLNKDVRKLIKKIRSKKND